MLKWLFGSKRPEKEEKDVAPKPHIVRAHYTRNLFKENELVVEWSDGTIEEYQGECTIWYKLPMMETVKGPILYKIIEIWRYVEKWGNDYPTAHLTQYLPRIKF